MLSHNEGFGSTFTMRVCGIISPEGNRLVPHGGNFISVIRGSGNCRSSRPLLEKRADGVDTNLNLRRERVAGSVLQ